MNEARLRRRVRDFLAEEHAQGLAVTCNSWLRGWDPGFSARLAQQGWVGMCVPPEYGGRGASPGDRYIVIEELLAAGAPVAAHWLADRQIAPCLLKHGSEKQRKQYLPGICAGEVFFAVGLSEPDTGSDLASVRTTAQKVAGGWRLTGTKLWTSGAHRAHAVCVLARTSPLDQAARHEGLSRFIVDLPCDGITVHPIETLTGEAHFNEVVLDEAFVPDSAVLGDIGSGWLQVTEELAFERSGPERFLSTYPLLQALANELRNKDDSLARHALGSLMSRLWTLRQMSRGVAAELDSGRTPDVAAALVKDVGTRFEIAVVELARTALSDRHAGLAPATRQLLTDAILEAPAFTLRGGTNEILRGIVARSLGLR